MGEREIESGFHMRDSLLRNIWKNMARWRSWVACVCFLCVMVVWNVRVVIIAQTHTHKWYTHSGANGTARNLTSATIYWQTHARASDKNGICKDYGLCGGGGGFLRCCGRVMHI